MMHKKIAELNRYKGTTINPMQFPEKIFELYSVPSYEANYPEILAGADIGSSKITVQENDVLICKINPRINRVWVVKHHTDHQLLASSEWIVVRNPEMDTDYLRWYFSSPTFRSMLNSEVAGIGGSLTRAQPKRVEQYAVPVCSLEEQRCISTSLNRVDNLIALYKQQLAKLDEMVKSRFIEMFGDPIRNTQNRPTTDFINVVKMQRGFDLPVQDRQQEGDIPVFGSNGALDRHDVAKVQGGGVITGRSGTIGKVYYTEGDYWPLNTSLFSVDTHGNNIIYLAYLLQMYDLSRFTEGTGVPTLNRNKFHDKPIIDVPLNEQEQFAVFVKQTDKSKAVVQKALDEAQTLFDSLMQQYFG